MKIKVNITKAKEIVKEKLRLDRKPLLEAQDILFMKAQEAAWSKNDLKGFMTEKQIRDISKNIRVKHK